jgi:UDP-N-acetylglucosamine:LPS N-acetylglucosamine transferase
MPVSPSDTVTTGLKLKICVVSSIGGHLDEVMQLYPVIREHDWFFVVNAEGSIPKEIQGRTIRVTHSERDWKLLVNFWEAAKVIFRCRPDVILSFGAGPAVPFGVVGKLVGARVVFVETFAAVEKPTLTGRLMYRISDLFIFQWKKLETFYPKGVYGGTVF